MKGSSKLKLGCLSVGGVWALLVILFLAIWQFLAPERPPLTLVPYSEFRALMSADREREPHVASAVFNGRAITFWVKDPRRNLNTKKVTIGPEGTQDLARELADHHIAVVFEEKENTTSETLIGTFALLFFGALAAACYGLFTLARVRKELASAMAEIERLKALLAQKGEAEGIPGPSA